MNSRKRVLILIVSYNAEAFLRSVLERIPPQVWNNEAYEARALIIDDQSKDSTFQRAREFAESFAHNYIRVLYNPVNQGYGGNQKIGYHYALKSNFDVVVLLHGDGQYAPECLDGMVAPIIRGEADVVLGSRMLRKVDALKGGMPLYKWLGNQLLSKIQNLMLGSKLAEFHTGYRAYSVEALRAIPFHVNSDYFDFDTDIIIQLLHTGKRIAEISIPTYYGKEISYVNGLKYSWLILMTTLQSKLNQLGIFYSPKFDYNQENQHYTLKLGYESSHQFALSRVQPGARILDVGSGPGYMAKQLANMGAVVTSVDRHITSQTSEYSHRTIACDIEAHDWAAEVLENIDVVFLLDIIEHIRAPERLLEELRLGACAFGTTSLRVIITTGNVAFLPVRLGLLLGWLNYGKKGILDKDHCRLFTFSSLRRLLRQSGYDILETKGISAPYPLALGDNVVSRLLLHTNSLTNKVLRGMFAYQIAMVARPKPTLECLLRSAVSASKGMPNRAAG